MTSNGQFSKEWRDLTFSDNFIFCKVMRKKELCKEFVEILLDIKIDHLEYINSEQTLDNFYNYRGIRMDVYLKDSDRVFDLEMQTGNYGDLLFRARFYQSSIDTSCLKHKARFVDLPESYIVFICREDPFNSGLPKYTVRKIFEENNTYRINDKTHCMFYNSSAYEKEENPKIKEILEFIYKFTPTDTFTKKLESETTATKADPIMEKEFMFFYDILEEEKERAREIGIKEGIEEGIKEGIKEGKKAGIEEGLAAGRQKGRDEGIDYGIKQKLSQIVNFMRTNNRSDEEIALILGEPLDVIEAVN